MAAEVMKRDLNGCPELEVIAAFLDRQLGDSDRAEVAGHLSSCETCYFVFSEAAQIKPTATPVAGGHELVAEQAGDLAVGCGGSCRSRGAGSCRQRGPPLGAPRRRN